MSDIQKLLEDFLIIIPELPVTKEEFSKSPYTFLDTCLIIDETWDLFFQNNFNSVKLKNVFETLSEDERTRIFKFGIACFLQFINCNFTGPGLEKQIEDYLMLDKFSEVPFVEYLSTPSESLNVNTKHPVLLHTARIVFDDCIVNDFINNWWSWRAIIIYMNVLDELTTATQVQTQKLYKALHLNLLANDYKRALLDIELAHLHLVFRGATEAQKCINSAKTILGIEYELKGAMGKRTKYQEKDLPQLEINVKLLKRDDWVRGPEVESMDIPEDRVLNDDVLLNHIQFSNETKEGNCTLTKVEEKCFLAIILNNLLSKPQDDLHIEELQPFIYFLLNRKNSYSVRAVTLFLRSKIEGKQARTIQRSLVQLEQIAMSWDKKTPHFLARVVDVFSTGMLPMWKIKALYADLLLNIGLTKEALEIYKELDLWEEIVVCYTIVNDRKRAADVINEQLAKKPTAKLYCLLGDATDDVSCYEKGLKMPRGVALVHRHWAQYYFDRKQYLEAHTHFQKSVGINPLQPVVWSRMAYAALQIKEWQSAITAYKRYTSMEPDCFIAWNNLAQAHLKVGISKLAAYACLKEAIRCSFENWKVWENLLVVSCDISYFSEVITAYHRLLKLKGKYLNLVVLKELVNFVVSGKKSPEGTPSNILLRDTLDLLDKLTAEFPMEGFIHELFAALPAESLLRAETYQKAYNGYTKDDWDKNPTTCETVLRLCNIMGELVLEDGIKANEDVVISAKLSLKSAVTAVKKRDWEETRQLVEETSSILKKVIEKAPPSTEDSGTQLKN